MSVGRMVEGVEEEGARGRDAEGEVEGGLGGVEEGACGVEERARYEGTYGLGDGGENRVDTAGDSS